jgi:hypothetical protein
VRDPRDRFEEGGAKMQLLDVITIPRCLRIAPAGPRL